MLNHITIMGRLTRDPELRMTQSKTPVASFTVACDRDYAAQGEERSVDFIDCVAWKAGAEFVSKYFRKGQMIVVDGRLQSRKWEDRDGNKRTSWEIVANQCYFGESKREESRDENYGNYDRPSSSSGNSYNTPSSSYSDQQPAPQQYQQQTFTNLSDDDGELPF